MCDIKVKRENIHFARGYHRDQHCSRCLFFRFLYFILYHSTLNLCRFTLIHFTFVGGQLQEQAYRSRIRPQLVHNNLSVLIENDGTVITLTRTLDVCKTSALLSCTSTYCIQFQSHNFIVILQRSKETAHLQVQPSVLVLSSSLLVSLLLWLVSFATGTVVIRHISTVKAHIFKNNILEYQVPAKIIDIHIAKRENQCVLKMLNAILLLLHKQHIL